MSSDLSRTLTEAAWAEMKDAPYTNWAYGDLPARAKARVDRTVVAVLRALELHVINEVEENMLHALDLNELAESVETGERTGP